jgi:retron-type reverse transcriptase
MRAVQFRILKGILEKVEIPDYIHAFEKDRSIPGMAAVHTEKSVVISLDLKNFFGSIKQFHLEHIFRHLGFGEAPALTLSELCTYKSFVPQGALTSPKVSNIVTTLTFGPIIKRYCDENNLVLSIYADDITISSVTPLTGTNGTQTISAIIAFVAKTIKTFGFRLNRDKIKVMKSHERQYVCGVVVNKKVNMLRKERMKLRAIVHRCTKNGVEAEAARNSQTASEFSSQIMGRLNWFAQLNPILGNALKDKFKEVCADQITCPTAEVESVKETGSLDNLLTVESLTASTTVEQAPW